MRQGGVEDLVPADHVLVETGEDLEHALIEVGLQRVRIRQVMGLHERENAG